MTLREPSSCFSTLSTLVLSLNSMPRVHLDLLALLDVLHHDLEGAVVLLLDALDLGVELKLNALLLQDALELLGHVEVNADTANVAEVLDGGDLGAEAAPDGAQLRANHASANEGEALGHLLQGQGARGRHNLLLVNLNGAAGKGRDLRADSHENVLGLDGLLAALNQVALNLRGARQLAAGLDVVDAVLLKEVLDAAGELVDGLVLLLQHLGEVELDVVDADAALLHVVHGLVVEVGVVQQRLGGDAAHVEAGAAQPAALLDAHSLEAELRGLDRADVSAGAAANDRQVVLLGLAAHAGPAEQAQRRAQGR